MLILIVGVTGMCGQACARAAFNAGHQVRGLARNPEKLSQAITAGLESFVKWKDVYDIEALDKAVKCVDAIISAAHPTPTAIVDGQILLLRAAERAGVKIFHAASWNYDWTKVQLGECESYDSYIVFRNHARLSSTIKPIYGFTGVIIEYLFYYASHSNPIDTKSKTLSFYGTGDDTWTFTVLEDLAAYAIQAISEPDAADGGFYYVDSFRCTTRELCKTFEDVYDTSLEPKKLGTLEDLDQMVENARASIAPSRYFEYIGWVYLGLQLRQRVIYDSVDSERWSHIKQTGLKQWLEAQRVSLTLQ